MFVVVLYVMTMQNWLFSAASLIPSALKLFHRTFHLFNRISHRAQNKWTKLFHFTMIFIVLLMSLRLSFVLLYRFSEKIYCNASAGSLHTCIYRLLLFVCVFIRLFIFFRLLNYDKVFTLKSMVRYDSNRRTYIIDEGSVCERLQKFLCAASGSSWC